MFIIIVLLHNKGLCFITVNWAKQLITLKNQVETQGHGRKGLHCFCCALLLSESYSKQAADASSSLQIF